MQIGRSGVERVVERQRVRLGELCVRIAVGDDAAAGDQARGAAIIGEFGAADRHRPGAVAGCIDPADGAAVAAPLEPFDTLDQLDRRIPRVTADSAAALRRLEDGVYLHQVVERSADGLARFEDLDAALASEAWRIRDSEWRVHFHVPVFLETLDGFASTQAFVREALALHRLRNRSPHLEVETYTWSVLPEHERRAPVEAAIARELGWVVGELS